MLNFRIKNPYRADEPDISDDENNSKNIMNFIFTNEDKTKTMVIPEFDYKKVLGSKIKIWSRDLETNEIERYFTDNILPGIKNESSLYMSFFLFESAIYSLIKRRDIYNNKKTMNRESTFLGLEKSSNMSLTNNSHNQKSENCTNNNNPINKISEFGENIKENSVKSKEKKSTRSTRILNPPNYNLNYNLNSLFDQQQSITYQNESNKIPPKNQNPKKLEKISKEIDQEKTKNFDEENSSILTEEDLIDETLSDDNQKNTKKNLTVKNLKEEKIELELNEENEITNTYSDIGSQKENKKKKLNSKKINLLNTKRKREREIDNEKNKNLEISSNEKIEKIEKNIYSEANPENKIINKKNSKEKEKEIPENETNNFSNYLSTINNFGLNENFDFDEEKKRQIILNKEKKSLNEKGKFYNNLSIPKKVGKPTSRYLNKSLTYEEEIQSDLKSKRITRRINSEAIKRKWNEKCYICFEYGELLCCENCSNVAHKFCACVEKIPEVWLCERCK